MLDVKQLTDNVRVRMSVHRTGDIARVSGLHPNTIRHFKNGGERMSIANFDVLVQTINKLDKRLHS